MNKYRYAFQGQEMDDEIKGEGNSVNYKYRMHDPRVGRFFSVDPLAAKYPYYTPYSFSGNEVIAKVELEGLEPAENPKNIDSDEKAAKADILTIGGESKTNNAEDNGGTTGDLQGFVMVSQIRGGMSSKSSGGERYVTDTKTSSANDFNMWVESEAVTFFVDESNSDGFNNYQSFVINVMLQNFINGTGPDHYIFPTNGIVSNGFLNSIVLERALNAFSEDPEGLAGVPVQYEFGAVDLFRNILRNEDEFNVPGFTGSATITITPNEKGVYVEIFNVTSLSSGALLGKILPFFDMPESYVRNQGEVTPFGNISQSYSLFLPWAQ